VPLILNPYGGPDDQAVTWQWAGMRFLFDQVLARHGFAVLHVDNRGMAGRGRVFAQAAFHDFGAVQLADQLASIDQVLTQYPQLDPQRLGWWGRSWGGTFTLYAMTHTARFRAGVAVAPVTDWRNYDSIYTERYLGPPDGAAARYDAYSIVEQAKNLKGRLMLVQGTADDNVHFGNTIQLIRQLDDAGIPYDLRIYPGETHGFGDLDSRARMYTQILSHFERYLMTPAGEQESPSPWDTSSGIVP
jgi:dipeptidyl-peptidase-4